MSSMAKLRSLVRDYFLERECEEVPSGDLGDVADLVFRDANNVIAVKVLDVMGLSTVKAREVIENSILSLASETSIDKAYVAVHTSKSAVLPSVSYFKSSGVGLLLISEGAVSEKVPARPKRRGGGAGPGLRALEERLSRVEDGLRELEALRAAVSRLEGELKALRERIAALERRGIAAAPQQRAPPPVTPSAPATEGIPDFVRGNPWLEVLMSRGEER